MKYIMLVLVVFQYGCSERYQIDDHMLDTITTAEHWSEHTPEIIYLAMRGDRETVDKLFRLIPMATKGDCTCLAGEPGDAAAIIIQREFEFDPTFSILGSMSQDDRNYAYRYIRAVPPQDFEVDDDDLVRKYNIAEIHDH